jgi:hypothetical protein
LDADLTAVTADLQSDFRLCPACVQEMDREARIEQLEAEVAALRQGVLHFQSQLIAAQNWILHNSIGLQPVQLGFQSTPGEEPEAPGILPRIFLLLDHADWPCTFWDGRGKETPWATEAQRVVQKIADGRYIFSTRLQDAEWDPPMWDPLPADFDGQLPVRLEALRGTVQEARAAGRAVHPVLVGMFR